ncbi:MAG: T9SS type A sorting domain-containing protein, partial [Flavobacteriaceae bacterium]|nr:T9SS type A sorting domain-containing protein [Flavobacteriaceae bacterium]
HVEEYYLDVHNGRFAITPEYPAGTYAYYATVDVNHNSTYPYVVGPAFYGNVTTTTVSSIPGGATNYVLATSDYFINDGIIKMYPNPTAEIITLQISDVSHPDLKVQLVNVVGQLMSEQILKMGSTICNFETASLYNGTYFVIVSNGSNKKTYKVLVNKGF